MIDTLIYEKNSQMIKMAGLVANKLALLEIVDLSKTYKEEYFVETNKDNTFTIDNRLIINSDEYMDDKNKLKNLLETIQQEPYDYKTLANLKNTIQQHSEPGDLTN